MIPMCSTSSFIYYRMKYVDIIIITTIISQCYTESEINIRNNDGKLIKRFDSFVTNFGSPLPAMLSGRAIMANPKNACKQIKPPPKYFNKNDYQWFVVIR